MFGTVAILAQFWLKGPGGAMIYHWTWSSSDDGSPREGPFVAPRGISPVEVWSNMHVMFCSASEVDYATSLQAHAGDLPPVAGEVDDAVPTTVVNICG